MKGKYIMIKIVKYLSLTIAVAGFILMLGTAGSDCDGKCMENSMPIEDILLYMLLGLFMLGFGTFGYMKANEYDY